MTCVRRTGVGIHGMVLESEFCDEHPFYACPLNRLGPRFKNRSSRWRGMKKVRGATAKALARYWGHPVARSRDAIRAFEALLVQARLPRVG